MVIRSIVIGEMPGLADVSDGVRVSSRHKLLRVKRQNMQATKSNFVMVAKNSVSAELTQPTCMYSRPSIRV